MGLEGRLRAGKRSRDGKEDQGAHEVQVRAFHTWEVEPSFEGCSAPVCSGFGGAAAAQGGRNPHIPHLPPPQIIAPRCSTRVTAPKKSLWGPQERGRAPSCPHPVGWWVNSGSGTSPSSADNAEAFLDSKQPC